MNPKDYNWLLERKNFMYVSTKISKEDKQEIYNIYNRLTGDKKKPNGCGRCMRTVTNLNQALFRKIYCYLKTTNNYVSTRTIRKP